MERACLPVRLRVETLCVYNQPDILSTGREQKTVGRLLFLSFLSQTDSQNRGIPLLTFRTRRFTCSPTEFA